MRTERERGRRGEGRIEDGENHRKGEGMEEGEKEDWD